MIGLVQPKFPCSMSANTGAPTPITASTAPRKSTFTPTCRTSFCPRMISNQIVTAMGTMLIANTSRHDERSTKRPPMSGPTMNAALVQAVHWPIALP